MEINEIEDKENPSVQLAARMLIDMLTATIAKNGHYDV